MREAGVLLPLTSLASPYGVGTLGEAAYRFIDFLQAAGQRYWQILPVGPTGYGDSPYQAFSSFAGNPYLIDLETLVGQGLLTREECGAVDFGGDPARVDYLKLYEGRFALLRRAFGRFSPTSETFQEFCASGAWWLEDYALFMSLKAAHGMVSFQYWPEAYRRRDQEALGAFAASHQEEIRYWKFLQYLFFSQWGSLKSYARDHGVRVIGDLPIYISPDSSDVWANGALFVLDGDLRPTYVAGCPPDAFSADGQLWGNPLYDWETHRESGYHWWLDRLRFAGEIYDVVRIDHFRGFESYYAIPAGDETAVGGSWRKGPGMDFIGAVKRELPDLRIIAEDLGFLTPEVARLLADSGFPGMKVLQFAFDSREESDYLPHNYGRNSVAYTGTHDNTTTADWEHSAPAEDVAFAREYLGITPDRSFPECFIQTVLGSVCDLAVVPLQDYLELGAQARINTPSTLGGNWTWRLVPDQLTGELARKMARMTKIYGR